MRPNSKCAQVILISVEGWALPIIYSISLSGRNCKRIAIRFRRPKKTVCQGTGALTRLCPIRRSINTFSFFGTRSPIQEFVVLFALEVCYGY